MAVVEAAADPLPVAVDDVDDTARGQLRRGLFDHLLKDPRMGGAASDFQTDLRQRSRGGDFGKCHEVLSPRRGASFQLARDGVCPRRHSSFLHLIRKRPIFAASCSGDPSSAPVVSLTILQSSAPQARQRKASERPSVSEYWPHITFFAGLEVVVTRSEERRVGKECRSRGSGYH